MGGGADISSFPEEKAWGSEGNFREIWAKSRIKIRLQTSSFGPVDK